MTRAGARSVCVPSLVRIGSEMEFSIRNIRTDRQIYTQTDRQTYKQTFSLYKIGTAENKFELGQCPQSVLESPCLKLDKVPLSIYRIFAILAGKFFMYVQKG